MNCELCHEPILEADRYLLCDVGGVHQTCAVKAVNKEVAMRANNLRRASDMDAFNDALNGLAASLKRLEDYVYRKRGA